MLICSQPKGGIPGLHPDQLLHVTKDVYGTTAAAAKWREAFTGYLAQGLGYEKSRYDSCLFLVRPRLAKAFVANRQGRRKKIDRDDPRGWVTM